jgi:hypothetical protein
MRNLTAGHDYRIALNNRIGPVKFVIVTGN